MKYTITVNHNEFASGVYDSYEDAVSVIRQKMREDGYFEAPADEDFDIYDYDPEGYYRPTELFDAETLGEGINKATFDDFVEYVVQQKEFELGANPYSMGSSYDFAIEVVESFLATQKEG